MSAGLCASCDLPFTDEEWDNRHDTPDGPVHAHCCDECEAS